MAQIIKIKANDGSDVEFYDEMKAQGGMKDVYFSPSKQYVVAFYRKPLKDLKASEKDRLQNIVGIYREKIFSTNSDGGYWKNLFAWPEKTVEWNGKIGVVVPFYDKKFFFAGGPFDGKEKNGKWFASAKLRNKFLPADQKGTWLSHIHVCIKIARAMRRLHAAGLAHSDLSYNNVLVDPVSGNACIIDDDGLVVPGKYPPDVVGTPDFIAPEVMETKGLSLDDPKRKLPSRLTDLHALAVLIYMYLLYRHPLRGGKVWDLDPAKDEEMAMGAKALFVEHPTDKTNRVKINDLDKSQLPQGDPSKLPYTICGPYLKPLFDRAFIDGLHNPSARPTAQEWEDALVKTTDLVQPCQNQQCEAHWFVFDNTTKPKCPFCGKEYKGQLPVLNFYYAPSHGRFMSENYRLMVYDKQTLYMWHVNRNIGANEKTSAEDKKPAGDFHFHNGQWILINRRIPDMYEILADGNKKQISVGGFVPLTEGRKILLSAKDGGRLVIVQLVNK
ncbi:MAG: kinase [Bacteroidales bacterium]|nr:kinase [Bacteroidales bacterium]